MAAVMDVVPVVSSLRARMAALGSASRAVGKAKYFKHVCLFYGVVTKPIELLHKDCIAPLALAPSQTLQLSSALLADPYHELKQLGTFTLYRANAKLTRDTAQAASTVDCVEAAFNSGHAADWATVDMLSSRVLAECIREHSELAARVAAWRTSSILWKQRASAVAFIKLTNPAFGHHDTILQVCDTLVHSPERFVQLGCGWLLREFGVTNAADFLAFMRANARFMSKEGLRYALEKSSATTKTTLTAAARVTDHYASTSGTPLASPARGGSGVVLEPSATLTASASIAPISITGKRTRVKMQPEEASSGEASSTGSAHPPLLVPAATVVPPAVKRPRTSRAT